MEFGLNFFPSVGPLEMGAAQYWSEALALVDEVDRLGFKHIRTVEHYFEPYGGYSPNPLLFLAAAAQRSKQAKLVAGAVLPVFNHPLKLAGEIGMVDALCQGRLEVGFARAFLPHEFARFGRNMDESRERFNEGISQVQQLLEKENVSCSGTFHSFSNVTSLPRPTQKPRPPFWIAAFATPQSFETAGRTGHNVMAIPLAGGRMAELVKLYRDAWKAGGHEGRGRVMLSFSACCMETTEKAAAVFKKPLEGYMRAMLQSASSWLDLESKDYPGYDKMIAALKEESFESQRANGICWAGSPRDIVNMITDYTSKVDFDCASLHIKPHLMPYNEAADSMKRFSNEVMPHFNP